MSTSTDIHQVVPTQDETDIWLDNIDKRLLEARLINESRQKESDSSLEESAREFEQLTEELLAFLDEEESHPDEEWNKIFLGLPWVKKAAYNRGGEPLFLFYVLVWKNIESNETNKATGPFFWCTGQ